MLYSERNANECGTDRGNGGFHSHSRRNTTKLMQGRDILSGLGRNNARCEKYSDGCGSIETNQ